MRNEERGQKDWTARCLAMSCGTARQGPSMSAELCDDGAFDESSTD